MVGLLADYGSPLIECDDLGMLSNEILGPI